MLKNIIIVSDFAYVNGGAAKVAISSAIGLSKLEYKVTLFSAVGPIDNNLQKSNVNVICLGQSDILTDSNRLRAVVQGIWNQRAKHEFSRLLSQLNPDETIIHFHTWIKALSSSLFGVTPNMKFRIVVTLHDYFTFCPNGGLFNYQTVRICEKKALSVNCLLCNCDARSYPQKIWRYIRQVVQRHTFAKNKQISFIFISNLNREVSYPYLKDISNKWYFVQNPIEINMQQPVNIWNNNKYLFVARLSSEKGLDLFCEAIRDLHLKGCVLGDGYLKDEMQKKYHEIEFKGWVTGKEKDEIIRSGRALIFPSLWYEGAPLTVVEMKSYGIPCIVPDKCSASEEVVEGRTGFIFKSGDLESLKQAIIRCESTNLMKIQENILNTFVVDKYTLEKHCQSLIDVYNDILGKS